MPIMWRVQSGQNYFTSSDLRHYISKPPRWHHYRCVSARWGLLDFLSASSPPRFLLFLHLLIASSTATICAGLICKLFNGTLQCQIQSLYFPVSMQGTTSRKPSCSPVRASNATDSPKTSEIWRRPRRYAKQRDAAAAPQLHFDQQDHSQHADANLHM